VEHPARQAEPGQTFTFNDFRGSTELVADDKGIVRPVTDVDEAACVAFGLPLAEKSKPARAGKETD
jgi:hypothetical protein